VVADVGKARAQGLEGVSAGSSSPAQRPRQPYGEDLAAAYGAEEAPYMVTRALRRAELSVTQLLIDRPPGRMCDPLPRQDAYMISCVLRDKAPFEYWEEGRMVAAYPLRASETTIHDLRREPTAMIDGPLHSMLWFVPRVALDALADEANVPHIDELRFAPGAGVADATIRQISVAMLPALKTPEQVSRLYADHVTLAFAAHLVQAYGGMRTGPRLVKGGLAPWQERRAREMLVADLAGAIPLAEIATACGLSTDHFARAFRGSTGLAPHAWLLQARIERAMALLRQCGPSLCEIALACGFVDQSHFTRVFVARVGIAPGKWRNTVRGSVRLGR